MIDIDGEVNSLILKYNVDKHYPLFKRRLVAVDRIRCWVTPYLTDPECMLAGVRQTDIEMFLWDINARVPWRTMVVDENLVYHESLADAHTHTVLIVSYFWRSEAALRLKKLYPQWNIISLYDYLESCGLYFEGDYYDIFRWGYYDTKTAAKSMDFKDVDFNAICYYDKKLYENANDWQMKMFYLEKLIFNYTFIRDFMNLERVVLEYCQLQGKYANEYREFYDSIQTVINTVKRELSIRGKKDIVMVWLDQLEYANETKMPFLHSLSEKGLVFTNAYTPTPFTHPAEKALFCGKFVVDDEAYKIKEINNENSPLLKMLEGHGYEFICLSRCICQGRQYRMAVNIYTPVTLMYWEVIRWMLLSEHPGFLLIHELAHTHTPCVSPAVTGDSYSYQYEWETLSKEEQRLQNVVQREVSGSYTDQQLSYYASLLPDSAFKIYMSDHGSEFLTRYHIILKICQGDILPEIEDRVFSLVHFKELVQFILKWDNPVKSLGDITDNYAIIQDIDHYNGKDIKQYINNRKMPFQSLFGYQGVVTQSSIYLKLNNGWEEYSHIENEGFLNVYDNIENLRARINTSKVDMNDEKFKYSHCLYQVWNHYKTRMAAFEMALHNEIRQLFCEIPSQAVLGLRGGGEHTLRILLDLDPMLRRKVRYIFDSCPKCKSAHMGIEVCSPEELAGKNINIIIISSYKKKKEWSKEIAAYNPHIHVIDLYEYLSEKGIACTQEFYIPVFSEEDFKIEMPL